MLLGFTISPSVGFSIVLIALVGYLLSRAFMRKVLKLDDKIDDRQEVYARLGGILELMYMPKLADICYKLSAINIDELIAAVRALVTLSKEGGPVVILQMLYDNFFKFQLPERMKVGSERTEIVRAVLGNPETKAEIVAALAEAKKIT